MKIRLLSVGKPRDREMGALHDRYAERIRRFGVTYDIGSVPETRAGGRFTEEHAREREARAIVEHVRDVPCVVALEPRGRTMSSDRLAEKLERWAARDLTLVIGGPSGLGDEALERADAQWSLSSLTLPHELVRVVVAEQLYRALTILRGVPYHR